MTHGSEPRPSGAIRGAFAALVTLGIVSVLLRLMFPADAGARLEPLREWLAGSAGTSAERAAEVAQFDAHFSAHRRLTGLHIIPGGLFLALVPLQLSRTLRARFAKVHRWNGRFLIALGVTSALIGLYFGVVIPFAGVGESVAIAAVTVWFFATLIRAYAAIRRGDVAVHRAWMLRAIAVPIGVSVVRVAGALADVALTPVGYSARTVFVVALWTGWAATIAVTEWWVRQTTPRFQE
jgi:uncharacterized membrane protein